MILVRPHQAKATEGKNVMVGESKPDLRGKELTREVAYEKTPDGRETFKIIHAVWSTHNRACPGQGG
jgi:hypothetical protein